MKKSLLSILASIELACSASAGVLIDEPFDGGINSSNIVSISGTTDSDLGKFFSQKNKYEVKSESGNYFVRGMTNNGNDNYFAVIVQAPQSGSDVSLSFDYRISGETSSDQFSRLFIGGISDSDANFRVNLSGGPKDSVSGASITQLYEGKIGQHEWIPNTWDSEQVQFKLNGTYNFLAVYFGVSQPDSKRKNQPADIDNVVLSYVPPSPVPEPTAGLFALILGAAALTRRRK